MQLPAATVPEPEVGQKRAAGERTLRRAWDAKRRDLDAPNAASERSLDHF